VPANAPAFDRYQVQVDVQADFASPDLMEREVAGPVTNSSVRPGGGLAPNRRYYWRVRSYNALGDYSAWSAVRSFRTAIAPPTLISPENGGTELGHRPLFTWSAPDGAAGYGIQVARDAKFTMIVKSASTVTPSFTPATDLPAAPLLYWRVRATGLNGPSAWSAVRSLTTVP
jgi:hypothetical protein